MTETVHGARDNNLAQDAQDSFTFGFSKNRQNLQVPPGSLNTVFSPEYMYTEERFRRSRQGTSREEREEKESQGCRGE